MYYYRKADRSVFSCYKRIDGMEEITEEEYRLAMDNAIDSIESSQQMSPPTIEERIDAMESAVLEMLGVTTND